MEKEHLYTVITGVAYTRGLFIYQLRTTKTHPSDILLAWITQAVEQGLIKDTEDLQVPFREIVTDNSDLPESFESVFNVWRIESLMDKSLVNKNFIDELGRYVHFSANFIKTSVPASALRPFYKTSPELSGSRLVRQAEAKYILYKERYTKLKDAHVLTNAIDKKRKQAEHWMTHWDAKRKLCDQSCNRAGRENENVLYTVVMYYDDMFYLRQFSNMLSTDAKQLLLRFVTDLFPNSSKRQIIQPADHALLMEKLSQDVYAPLPVAESINVWGTYCSLNEDIARLFIIKTALDEVMYEE